MPQIEHEFMFGLLLMGMLVTWSMIPIKSVPTKMDPIRVKVTLMRFSPTLWAS